MWQQDLIFGTNEFDIGIGIVRGSGGAGAGADIHGSTKEFIRFDGVENHNVVVAVVVLGIRIRIRITIAVLGTFHFDFFGRIIVCTWRVTRETFANARQRVAGVFVVILVAVLSGCGCGWCG
jgi:hypothetical protein